MSHAITFDTLAFAKKLESSGMETKYAEGFSKALSEVFDHSRETVATKQDVEISENSTKHELTFLRTDFNAAKSELKAELNAVTSELNSVKSELKAELNSVKSGLKSEMIMWIVGLLFAQTAIMISVMKFVH